MLKPAIRRLPIYLAFVALLCVPAVANAIRLKIDIGNAKGSGVIVLKVDPGPGKGIGLKKGDVIMRINGKRIDDMDDYYKQLNKDKDRYTITWMRERGEDWYENDIYVGKYGAGEPRRVPPDRRGK